MRSALRPAVDIVVDANNRWNAYEAIRFGRACESLNLFWLEKPVQPDDVRGCREVKSVPDIPVATGENIDELVYQLYGITDEERRIIEGA